jgi:hypothetical protein
VATHGVALALAQTLQGSRRGAKGVTISGRNPKGLNISRQVWTTVLSLIAILVVAFLLWMLFSYTPPLALSVH